MQNGFNSGHVAVGVHRSKNK